MSVKEKIRVALVDVVVPALFAGLLLAMVAALVRG